MKISIANDHGGYRHKKRLMVHLQRDRNNWVVNEGSDSGDKIVRYPYYAAKVACAVARGEVDFGILICNSGVGMSIAANKFPGVRAALVYDAEGARLAREHNNANIICLPAAKISPESAVEFTDIFISTPFAGGRHSISIGLLDEIDKHNFSGDMWCITDMERRCCMDGFYRNGPSAKPRILLDTDMLTDCDDAAALALLLQLEKNGAADILAMTVSSSYPRSAAVVSAVNSYYGRADIPIGAPKNGTGYRRDDSCFLDKVAAEFPHDVESNDTAPDAVDVMREALAASEDGSVELVTIGYMSNLASLLKSGPDSISPLPGMELARTKIREWVCMAGNFPDDPARDNVNFTRDSCAALTAVREFPGRITFAGRDIGHNVFLGNEFHDMPLSNPVRRAYELHRGRYGSDWDHHTADPSTIMYAVFGLGEFFDIQPGTMILHDDCSFEWNPSAESNMAYLLQRMDRKAFATVMSRIIMDGTIPPYCKLGKA